MDSSGWASESKLQEQSEVIAENEARIQEIQATTSVLEDELDILRTKEHDEQTRNENLSRELDQLAARRPAAPRTTQPQDPRELERATQALRREEDRLNSASDDVYQIQLEFDQLRRDRQELAKRLEGVCRDLSRYVHQRHEESIADKQEPLSSLEKLRDLNSERERDYYDSERELRELKALISMKSSRIGQIENHEDHKVHAVASERNESIDKLRRDIDEERRSLRQEIAILEQANEEQARSLKLGARRAEEQRALGNGREEDQEVVEHRAKLDQRARTEANRDLMKRNEQMKEEIRMLKQQEKEWKEKRQSKIMHMREEKNRSDREKAEWNASLKSLDRQIDQEKKAQERLNLSLRKLKDRAPTTSGSHRERGAYSAGAGAGLPTGGHRIPPGAGSTASRTQGRVGGVRGDRSYSPSSTGSSPPRRPGHSPMGGSHLSPAADRRGTFDSYSDSESDSYSYTRSD